MRMDALKMTDKMEIPDFSKYPELDKFLHEKDKYILDENNNTISANTIEWALFFQNNHEKRIVKKSDINGYLVSTVFFGINHNFDIESSKPLIFETMAFDNSEPMADIYCDRYSTWAEAEEGHEKAILWVKNEYKDK